MKKIIFIAILILSTLNLSAQDDDDDNALGDFRKIFKDIPNQFDNLKKDLLEDNTEKNYKIFSSKIEDMPFSKAVVSVTQASGHLYVMRFDVMNMDVLTSRVFDGILGAYMKEINDLVKTGNYSGEDYKHEGSDFTEIKDRNGNIVVQYSSNLKEHLLVFYGARNK